MIIDQMTLRVKNIIFFKIVCISLAYILFSYLISAFTTELANTQIKNLKAEQITNEAMERLQALQISSQQMQETVKFYKTLENGDGMQDNEACFDQIALQKNIHSLEKNFDIKEPIRIMLTASPLAQKYQPKQTLILRSTHLETQYNAKNFTTAIDCAAAIYKISPKYSIIKKLDIVRHNSITPALVQSLSNSNTISLISTKLNIDIRQVGLNNASK